MLVDLQEDIAKEAETGKVYRVPVLDKQGRTVLMMRPAKQVSVCTTCCYEITPAQMIICT
jgi:hypothetical protein